MNHYVTLALTNRKSSVHLHAVYSPRTALRTFTPRRDHLVVCLLYVETGMQSSCFPPFLQILSVCVSLCVLTTYIRASTSQCTQSSKSIIFNIVTYSGVLFTMELYCTTKFNTQLLITINSAPNTTNLFRLSNTTQSLFKPTGVRRQIHTHVLTRAISKPNWRYP
jgi:hypothetical protein